MVQRLRSVKLGSNLIPRKSNEQRRREIREKVLRAAGILFYDKGFSRTTMRQIAQRAGVLNGSLYNVFSSKEEILRTMIDISYGHALDQYGRYVDSEDDLLVALAFPMALELYSASKDKKAAEILYEAHRSWAVVDSIADRTMEWIVGKMEGYGLKQDCEDMKDRFLVLLGALGSLISKRHFSEADGKYKGDLRKGLGVFCALFGISAHDLDAVVERMDAILVKNDIAIGGYRI